jgi:hypothetical protein
MEEAKGEEDGVLLKGGRVALSARVCHVHGDVVDHIPFLIVELGTLWIDDYLVPGVRSDVDRHVAVHSASASRLARGDVIARVHAQDLAALNLLLSKHANIAGFKPGSVMDGRARQ